MDKRTKIVEKEREREKEGTSPY